MKKLYIIIFLFLSTSYLSAQIQNSNVREINSDKKPLPNVYIKFTDAVPTTSDDNGNFRLAFSGKKAGELIFMEKIEKSGYEIVNKKELEVLTISDNDKLPTDIIMAKKGFLVAAKKEYYDVSDAALLAAFEREKTGLRQQLQQSQITQSTFLEQKKTLQKQYDAQKIALDAIADKFARVNFDDVDSLYKQAIRLFKKGKVLEAQTQLENINLIDRTETRLKERERINQARIEIERQETVNEEGLLKDIQLLHLLVQTYQLNFEIDKVEILFDRLLELDSTNVDLLWEAGDFYGKYHKYKKGIHTYQVLLQIENLQLLDIINIQHKLSDIHRNLGEFDLAIEYLEKANEQLVSLCNFSFVRLDWREKLIGSYIDLVDMYIDKGKYGYANFYNQKAIILLEISLKDSPNNIIFEHLFSSLYEKQGKLYNLQGKHQKELKSLQSSYSIRKKIYKLYPKNETFIHNIGVAAEKIGDVFLEIGELDSAKIFFTEYHEKIKLLDSLFPNNFRHQNSLSLTYSKLGRYYFVIGQYQKALLFYNLYYDLTITLNKQYPLNYEVRLNIPHALGIMSDIYMNLDSYQKAESCLYEAKSSILSSINQYPNSLRAKGVLGDIYHRLGNLNLKLNNYNVAKINYLEHQKTLKDLLIHSPNNVQYKSSLAISHAALGQVNLILNDSKNALYNLKQAEEILLSLIQLYPNNLIYQYDLATTYSFYSKICKIDNDIYNQLFFLEKALVILNEISNLSPKDITFNKGLMTVLNDLVSYYYYLDVNKTIFYLKELEGKLLVFLSENNNQELIKRVSLIYIQLGETYLDLDSIIIAKSYYLKSYELIKSFNSKDEELMWLWGITNANLGNFFLETDMSSAKGYFLEAKGTLTKLNATFPDNKEYFQILKSLEEFLSNL